MSKKFIPKNLKELKILTDNENISLNDIDTHLITDMSNLFKNSVRKNYDGIENWDTSNVEYMHGMFSYNIFFNNDISKWNVSKVRIMSQMFHLALIFNKPLNDWNVKNVENMNMMFNSAKEFNQPLNNWNVSKVKKMNGMFANTCKFNQNINDWNISNVEEMDNMFNGAIEFNQPLNNWDVSKVESMHKIFANTSSFNQDLDCWNIKKLHSMNLMFENSFMEKNDKISLRFKIYSYCLTNNENEKSNLSEYIKNIDILKVYNAIHKSNNKQVILFCKELENNYADKLKYVVNNFSTIEKAEIYIENNYNKKDEKKVKFIDDLNIENVFTKDKTKTVSIKIIKYIYLSYLALKRDVYKIILIDNIINLLDRESFINAIKTIYTSTNKETSAIIYGIYGGDEALKEIYKKEKYSKLLLIILSLNKESNYAISLICNIFRNNERDDIQEMVANILNEVSQKYNLTADELILKMIPTFGFDKNGEKIIDKYKLTIKNNDIEIFDIENNKILKSYPKSMADNTKEEIKYIKKEIPNTIKNQNMLLIKLLMNGKKYSYKFFNEIFIDNKIMNRFATCLIWNMHTENSINTFRYSNDGSYNNENDENIMIDKNSYISLANNIDMDKETIKKWKNIINDYELSQPIMQFSAIEINNLEKTLNKLQNIEINYGILKSFVNKYQMKTHFLNTNTINKYYFYDSNQYFYIDTNISYYANADDKVIIKPYFTSDNELNKRFIYTWLTFMIWDLNLKELV